MVNNSGVEFSLLNHKGMFMKNLILLHANNKGADQPMSECIQAMLPAKLNGYSLTGKSDLQQRVCNRKFFVLFFNQNILCAYSKEPSK